MKNQKAVVVVPATFLQTTAGEKRRISQAITRIAGAEQTTVNAINEWLPRMITGCIAGDHIAPINGLLLACRADRRRILAPWIATVFPHELDKGTLQFGKKLKAPKQVQKRIDAMQAFIDSGLKVFDVLEAAPAKPEAKPKDFVKLVGDLVAKGVKAEAPVNEMLQAAIANSGLSLEDVLGLLEAMVASDESAEAEAA